MTRTVLHGGLFFDGHGDRAERADVVIENGAIVAVGADLDADEGVDCAGGTVVPGLIDCHVHAMLSGGGVVEGLERPFSLRFYQAIDHLRATLAAGVTTVRDAGGADLGLKRALELGLIGGPRMLVSLAALSQTGGHGDTWHACGVELPLLPPHPGRPHTIVDSPDEMRRAVRTLIRMGADVLKVCTSGGVISPRSNPHHGHFGTAELAVLQEEAAAADVPVMAHAHAAAGIKNAIRHGVRSIEHGVYLDDEAIDMMVEGGVWLVPTLSAPVALAEQMAQGATFSTLVRHKAAEAVAAHEESFRRAVDAGVMIAMGTDSGVGVHGTNLRELELMQAYGLSGAEALRAATSSAARLLRLEDSVGSIRPGMDADVVVLDGDLSDMRDLTSRVRAVFQRGRHVATTATGPMPETT